MGISKNYISLLVMCCSIAGCELSVGPKHRYSDDRPMAKNRMEASDEGIVLRYGDGPDSCDIYGARDVFVYEHEGTYYMHYDGAGPKGWLAVLATSKDLKNWEKKGAVLELGGVNDYDSKSASYGSVYYDGSKWHMFYLGTPNVSEDRYKVPQFPYTTMKAISDQPQGPWTKQKDVVPFFPQPDTYYGATASPGHIVRHNSEYLQFFSASTPFIKGMVKRTIGIARTDNLNTLWKVDPEPILPLEEQIENASLYFEVANQTWFLFTNHVGIDGVEYTDAVWVYWTKDLTAWDPNNKAIVLDKRNCSWSKQIVGLPSVIKVGDKLAVFYDGLQTLKSNNPHMYRHIGLAWLNLPLNAPQ